MINIYSLNAFDILRMVERHGEPTSSIDLLAFKQIASRVGWPHAQLCYAKQGHNDTFALRSCVRKASLARYCRPSLRLAGQASLRSACQTQLLAIIDDCVFSWLCSSRRNIVFFYYILLYDYTNLDYIISYNG